jgi:hypothetical protein
MIKTYTANASFATTSTLMSLAILFALTSFSSVIAIMAGAA